MCWCLPVITGFVLVGVPYIVCFVAQWIFGLPDKPGFRKYIEALNPRRIYYLTFVTIDLLKYFYYLRLYYQIRSWYRNENNSQHHKKGIVYGHRGNKLDYYYAPRRNKYRNGLPPLVVFVYGGAWSTGHRSTYCLLARQMAENMNVAVVCPDYSTYPKDQIVLVGHSAGAHLATLATLLLLNAREELLIEPKLQQEILHSLRGVIGMSGVYSIMDHYKHEQRRGIEFISCMSRAMNGEENFPPYSPMHIVKNISADKLRRAPRFVLLHGGCDIVVPADSSTKFYKLLSSLSVKVSLHLLPAVSHTDIVIDLMLPSRRFYVPLFVCLHSQFLEILRNF